MSVNLVKTDLGGDGKDLVDGVELVDEGVTVEELSRPRAWWGQIFEYLERHADAPQAADWAVARPDLSAYHAFNRAGLLAVRAGAVIILRRAWTLTSRGWALVVTGVRKRRGSKSTAAGNAEGSAKSKWRGGKAASSGASTGDLLVGGALLVGMGALFLMRTVLPAVGDLVTGVVGWMADHPVDVIRAASGFLIVFVVVAWVVGATAGACKDHGTEAGDVEPAEEAVETEPVEDHDQESGDGEANPPGGEVVKPSPEEVAAAEQIEVYAWVRKSIRTRGNGTAVHLRELALDGLPEGGDMRYEIGQVRALLAAHQITVRDGVKAPASDADGATRNRPGVHSADLPETYTPLPAQGGNLVRLLPVGQPSELQ